MPVGSRRSDLEIVRDILRMDPGGAPTQLRYDANLSYPQFQKYLAYLEQSHLVEMERKGPQIINVLVTDKGRRILRLLDGLFVTLGFEPPAEDGRPI